MKTIYIINRLKYIIASKLSYIAIILAIIAVMLANQNIIGSNKAVLIIYASIFTFLSLYVINSRHSYSTPRQFLYQKWLKVIFITLFCLTITGLVCKPFWIGKRELLTSFLLLILLGITTVCVKINQDFLRDHLMIMLSSLLMLTTSIYLIYPPSLGNDTWRDLIYAYEITVSGRVRYTYHSPYPISFLSLIYSLISIVSGIELRWTTALYGFLYQFCLLISVFMLTRRLFHNDKAALLSTLIISISPNLMLWVYGPIPQIHALLLLTLLLLINVTTTNVDGVYMITTIFLLIAQIITHVVVALQTLTVFVGLYLLSKMLNYKYEEQGTFRTMLLCFLVSFTYWLMMYIIEYLLYGPIRNIYTLLVELFTEKAVSKAYSTSPATPPYVLFLVYSYFYIIPILTFVTWLTYDSREKTDGSGGKTTVYIETFFITSISFTSLGFLGNLFMPHLYLDRYLGIGAYILMGILSGYGLLKLSCKGKLGISLTVVVLVLIIASATVSGVFSPDYRPLGTTYASYSVSGPTNHNEYEIALTISEKLENGTLWVDYRYGQQLIFLAIQDPQSGIRKYEHLYRGIKVSGLEIMCIGSYGWKISSEDVKRFMSRQNSILIFREHAFEELLLSSEREKIKNYLHENTNIVFSTDKVKIFISL